jgi:hypothetical protein
VAEIQGIFSTVFKPSFQKFILQRALKRQSSSMLDLMGFGWIFHELSRPDWCVSLSLSDNRNISQIEEDKANKILHVYGNVLDLNTWRQLEAVIKTNSIRPFGLIIWAPAAGFRGDYITHSDEVYDKLVSLTWSLLADGGVLLAEIPHRFSDSYSRHTQTNNWAVAMVNQVKQVAPNQRICKFDFNLRTMMLQKVNGFVPLPIAEYYCKL